MPTRKKSVEMSHGHDEHAAAPAVAGEVRGPRAGRRPGAAPRATPSRPSLQPTPFLSDPSQFTTTRCKRRFNDLVLLQLDARSPESVKG